MPFAVIRPVDELAESDGIALPWQFVRAAESQATQAAVAAPGLRSQIPATTINIPENTKAGAVVLDLAAGQILKDLKFSITDNPAFEVDKNGIVKVKQGALLDYETIQTFHFDTEVLNQKTGTLNITTYTVNVDNISGLTYRGGENSDIIVGLSEEDQIWGLTGNDTIYGMMGNDCIYGGAGDDLCNGGAGNDSIAGDKGADTLYGGSGNDTLTGGSGDDVMWGGDGKDVFVFEAGFGKDTIKDFTSGADKLKFAKGLFKDWDAVWNATKQVGSDLKITAGTDTITLVGVSTLTEKDVILNG